MWPTLHGNKRSQIVHIVKISTVVWLLGNRDLLVHANDHYAEVKLKRNKLEYRKHPNMFR